MVNKRHILYINACTNDHDFAKIIFILSWRGKSLEFHMDFDDIHTIKKLLISSPQNSKFNFIQIMIRFSAMQISKNMHKLKPTSEKLVLHMVLMLTYLTGTQA